MYKLLLAVVLGIGVLGLYFFNHAVEPDPKMVSLAVRATVYAMPTPTPRIVEVTRVVQVTQVVEVTRLVEVTRVVESTPTPTPTKVALSSQPERPAANAASVAVAARVATNDVTAGSCPAGSGNRYASIPVVGPHIDHPDSLHGDLNLALRGYVPTDAVLSLVNINGPADGDAPQLPGLFDDGRLPKFTQAYRVRDWNWSCGNQGCRGDPLSNVEVSLLGMQTTPGETIHIPRRGAEIYGGGYIALVLYADSKRITLSYTREDSVANGYTVHIEEVCVDPNLLSLYHADNNGGRGTLPAVHNGEAIGTAAGGEIAVAVRDRGGFTDPRSRKDWWHGY